MISTGGGVIEDRENWRYLKYNSQVIYIERYLDQLDTKGRPLSQGRLDRLNSIYEKRNPVYKKLSDYRINNKNLLETVEEIKKFMKKILVINGPNLNVLGIREPEIYGVKTYEDLCREIKEYANKINIEVDTFQSNHEGELIDIIQKAYGRYYGIIINPGAYTHTSIAILDALKAVGIRTIEVHLTDIMNRDDYRKKSFVSEYKNNA